MAKKLARLKKTVKRSTRLTPVKTVRARRSRRQEAVKGPLVSAETLERAATAAAAEDPVVALAEEKRLHAATRSKLSYVVGLLRTASDALKSALITLDEA